MKAKGKIARDLGMLAGPFRFRALLFVVLVAVFVPACGQLQRPKTEPFYAQTAPPTRQEFRWSNGRSPKSLDPAKAGAAPETDIVRTIFEGLTDIDPRSLHEVPGVAEKWEASPDLKTWTFHLRKEARWSNGEPVIADDFVNSWKRLAQMKDQAANKYLFRNIVGMKETPAVEGLPKSEPNDYLREAVPQAHAPLQKLQLPPINASPHTETAAEKTPETAPTSEFPKFGVVAADTRILKVTLELPDKDFAKLVANPVFRPIYGDGAELNNAGLNSDIVTNGAFRIVSIGDNGISLERAEYYWDRKSVGLERVRFVPMDTAEKALDAYRAGNIDAVSNADFEPLVLKLLTPFEDFRRTTHSALNFYEVNVKNAPFNDRRVRAALAISIDRDRLTEGELEGSTQPAYSFLPLGESHISALSLDVARAKDLLTKAGYPNGENFPQVRLVINRNDTQQRVAKSVARMWQQNLNLDTLIVVKESSEMERTRAGGEYDLIRRGAVMPTTDELVSLTSVFGSTPAFPEQAVKDARTVEKPYESVAERTPTPAASGPKKDPENSSGAQIGATANATTVPAPKLTEEESIFNIYAIPLYFPTSYSLVKPYVRGFDMNGLDAPSLKDVTIDNTWQPKALFTESN